MKQTFTHLFKDGRAASQIYELDLKDHTYRFVAWEFSQPDVVDQITHEGVQKMACRSEPAFLPDWF